MVSRRDKAESEEDGPEVSASAEAVEVGGDLARSFETFPSRDVPRAEFSESASKCPANQTECERRIPMRRKGATLVCVRGYEYQLALLAGGGSGIFGRGQNAGGKG